MLRFQTSFSDYLLNTTKECETVMTKFLAFEPQSEIDRFAKDASQYNFQLSSSSKEVVPNNASPASATGARPVSVSNGAANTEREKKSHKRISVRVHLETLDIVLPLHLPVSLIMIS